MRTPNDYDAHESRFRPIERGFRPALNILHELNRDPSTPFWDRDMGLRSAWVHAYSWAVPSANALALIRDETLHPRMPHERWDGRRVLLDPMCGTGYWASLLRDMGLTVIASDLAPCHNAWAEGTHIDDAITGDAEHVVRSVDADALLLVWPPAGWHQDGADVRALKAFRGDVVFFIGERGEDGVTGTTAFFDALLDNWHLTHTHATPRWAGMHDDLTVYRRKRNG